jgi:SAM-dependent methyltransferase
MDQSQLYTISNTAEPTPIVEFIAYLRDLYGLPRSAHILDMGCGPGRMLGPLSRAGWEVTGYEPDPDFAVAAAKQAESLAGVRVVGGGLVDVDEESVYDLIAAVNGPYSYLLETPQRRNALTRCARALKPGGVLFLDLANFWWILKHYRAPEPVRFEVDGGEVLRTPRHELDFHHGHWTHHDHFAWLDASGEERSATKTHAMAMVTFSEIAFFLGELGFEEVHTFNSYEDREPAPLAGHRVMVTARRPREG